MKRVSILLAGGLALALAWSVQADMHQPAEPKLQLILGGLAWHIGQDRDKRHHGHGHDSESYQEGKGKGSGWGGWQHKRRDFDEELFQPAIGLAYGAWEVIAYENSFDDVSLFLGYNHYWPLAANDDGMAVYCGLRAGVATGYEKSDSDLVAVLHPNVSLYMGRVGLELGVLPTGLVDPMKKRSDAVFTTALRFKF